MFDSGTQIAVLTGDLVDSTSLGSKKVSQAFDVIEKSSFEQEAWHGAPLHFTRQRGDGWQVALARPKLALRSALAFRAALRAEQTDARMAVALGPRPSPEALAEGLNAQNSEPFVKSGRDLDALKRAKTDIRLSHDPAGAMSAVFAFADHISRSWTPAQAQAMLHFLPPERASFTDIAETLGKSRQAVSKALYSAGLDAFVVALAAVEAEKNGGEHD